MKKLYAYLLKSFIGPFFLTFIISVFILLMQFIWRYIDNLVGKGLENTVILELISYAIINLIPTAVPLSVLLASIMTFGNLGERFELLAMKSSGVSLLKIMRPLILLTSIITITTFFLANEVVPVANAKFVALLWSINNQKPEMLIKEGVFSNEIDNFSIKVNKRDQASNTLHDIMIYDHRKQNGNKNVIVSDSGYLKMSDNKQHMILTLYNGERYEDLQSSKRDNTNYPFLREHFQKKEMIISVENFNLKRADEKNWSTQAKMLKNQQIDSIVPKYQQKYKAKEAKLTTSIKYNSALNAEIHNAYHPDKPLNDSTLTAGVPVHFDTVFNHLNKFQKNGVLNSAQEMARTNQLTIIQYEADLENTLLVINKYWIEWHKKYTLAIACLLFFFIGAPLGAIIRKGGFGMPVVVSILLFISYYLISVIGEKIALGGVLQLNALVWFPSFLFLVIGSLLTHQAVTDSILLNTEMYKNLVNRFLELTHIKRNSAAE